MIIGQSSPQHAAMLAKAGRSTLDDIFRRAVARRPEAVALADPPNTAAVTGAAPRRLTYAQADRMITAIAGRLRHLGLQTDQVVALQMANTVDAVVTLLGILRAGLIAMPLPLAWRQADCVAALNRVGARALVVSSRIGAVDHCEVAMHVAAEVFMIRQVCGFGPGVADGVIGLDDLYDIEVPEPPLAITRSANPAAHTAIITWDATSHAGADGLVPVRRAITSSCLPPGARRHAGKPHRAERRDPVVARPALACGARARPRSLAAGRRHARAASPVRRCGVPGAMPDRAAQRRDRPGPARAARLGETEALNRENGIKTLIAAWRAPDRMTSSPNWTDPAIGFVDVPVFGETALFAARRGGTGRPASLALGPVAAPRGAPGALQVIELDRTATGTLAVRGPQVPRFPLPFERNSIRAAKPAFPVGSDGFCRYRLPLRRGSCNPRACVHGTSRQQRRLSLARASARRAWSPRAVCGTAPRRLVAVTGVRSR